MSPGPARVRLAHLSDIHFGCEDVAACAAAIEAVAAFAPDLVVVTGDLTRNGLPSEFAAARAWLKRLPGPRLVTPGNHDTPYWNLPMRAAIPFGRYRRYIGPIHQAVDGAGVVGRAVNSARGAQPRLNWSKGAVRLSRIRNAGAELAAAGSALKVFACHHPLREVEGERVAGGVRRGDAASGILAAAGIDLILTGHLHLPFAFPLPYGDGRTYAVGAGTLSVRTRGTPSGFSLIEADADQITVMAQGWTGSHFEPLRTWGLPRRQRPGA
ncbi:MAG TPA: metallophosphoesterase [Caulobacteraceae bacterium]|jgi:3',5'-cyclic AMP phosphodiesterase CpdA|nr:metallophosphoesterase [Caulobacteraceae bacterium]